MTTTTLTQARDLIRKLSIQEKLYLLNDLTAQLIHDSTLSTASTTTDFPTFHVMPWPADLPLRREELYDDRER